MLGQLTGSLSIGGGGASGGTGNTVKVVNTGSITTLGADSNGIIASSTGGGGGDGGFALSGSFTLGAAGFAVSVGGTGSGGGNSNTVSLINTGSVSTSGVNSMGILAQSLAGGGGDGGFSGAISGGTGKAGLGLSLGRSGGAGGTAAAVDATTNGNVTTKGNDSIGLLAQSVGGGGGDGGVSVSVVAGTGISPSVSVGGGGGSGGVAANVTVNSTGAYQTGGNFSQGIIAQSVGGGGGTGGFSVSGAFTSSTPALSASVGGNGGNGGNAADVSLSQVGSVTTSGFQSAGVLAQSLGGGGGNGGFSGSVAFSPTVPLVNVSIAVGGKGGEIGGTSGFSNLYMNGSVQTAGDDAPGVESQSVGGGGGNGGLSVGANVGSNYSVSSTVGGDGGNGGTSGKAYAYVVNGTITTGGKDSYGIEDQSVGGGGGNGGLAMTGTFTAGGNSAAATVGGNGGTGNNAAAVSVSTTDTISTTGAGAHGIFEQSLGGGGGAGGYAGAFTLQAGSSGLNLGVSVGGMGAQGGNAATAYLNSSYLNSPATSITTGGQGADAILVQSTGGGGGDGGFAFTANLAASRGTTAVSGSLSASVGGNGDRGGDAGKVIVENSSALNTTGATAQGLVAQSIGGGGGDGGIAATGTLSAKSRAAQVSIAVGGNGDNGGNGSSVDVRNTGATITTGTESTAMIAQSIGGGGGNGGASFAGSISGANSVNSSVTVGGNGGIGGVAGNVTVNNTGGMATYGYNSLGILAQSSGGGGGNGGATGALASSRNDSLNVTVSIGGKGDTGGLGGTVSVTNSGIISTSGESSEDIFAQSVGGGGGHGGNAGLSATQFLQYLGGGGQSVSYGERTMDISTTVGGNGGTGNNAADVTVNNLSTGALYTLGDSSEGIYAQSIGGGGGGGGVSNATAGALGASVGASLAIAVGGQGGAAGNGANVTVTNNASITTTGDASDAIFAQSIGGGGGVGGNAKGAAETLILQKNPAHDLQFNASVSIGGRGGAAGNGAAVTLTNTGAISTAGSDSDGLFAESIGGGGGTGGSIAGNGSEYLSLVNLIGTLNEKTSQTSSTVSVGGTGGASGSGAAVTLTNSGAITTVASNSDAIQAQSVGGGGGVGGNGDPAFINVGGNGAVSGNGGAVTVRNSGALSTTGGYSDGIEAQSIGGGGGDGGNTSTLPGPIVNTYAGLIDTIPGYVTLLKNAYSNYKSPSFGLSIGGQAGAAGNGGVVSVTSSASISTTGDYAHGIFAQSIGGGGGVGGEGVLSKAEILIPGTGGSAGSGGAVTVNNTGSISTSGNAAFGIVAQSIGGGGGDAGAFSLGVAAVGDISNGFTLSDFAKTPPAYGPAGSGDGGVVTITNSANITVTGYGAIGILGQSLGGGGGLIGQGLVAFAGSFGNNGRAGTVTLTDTGNVISSGEDGIGIMLQSAAKDGQSDVTATISGNVTGGFGPLAKGIFIDGGNNNTLTINSGTISAASGLAIIAGPGNETVSNAGTIVGNVDLGAGVNNFTNQVGGVFASGPTVNILGPGATSGGLLTNKGTISPGGDNTVQTTTITGSYNQVAGATYVVTMDPNLGARGSADRINVTGTAQLDGSVRINIINMQNLKPLFYRFDILSADNYITNYGISTVSSPFVIRSGLQVVGDKTLELNFVANYTPTAANLSANQKSVGAAISALEMNNTVAPPAPFYLASGPVSAKSMANSLVAASFENDLTPILSDTTGPQLAYNYEQYSPHTYASAMAGAIEAGAMFNDALMSCDTAASPDLKSDAGCAWMRVGTRRYASSAEGASFHESSTGVQVGAEADVAEAVRIGAGFSGESVDGGLSGLTDTRGWRYQVGATAKTSLGALDLSLALSAGTQQLRTNRQLPGGTGNTLHATADQTIWSESGTLQLSHSFEHDGWYLKPLVDFTVGNVHSDALQETGAGLLNLQVLASNQFAARVSPALELGWDWNTGDYAIRPFARVGVTRLLAGQTPHVDASFAGAPAGTPYVIGQEPLDRSAADLQGGVTVARPDGFSLNLYYAGQAGSETRDNRFGANFHMPF